MNCCVECFDNVHIKEHISKRNKISSCDFCQSKYVPCCGIADAADYIFKKILAAYEKADDIPSIQYSVDRSRTEVLTIREIFTKESVISSKLSGIGDDDKLYYNLIQYVDDKTLEYEFDDGLASLCVKQDPYGIHETKHHLSWKTFKYRIKHFSRFFGIGKYSTDELLAPIGQIIPYMSKIIPTGSEFWRLRRGSIGRIDSRHTIADEIGPPPPMLAEISRMSPQGIPYLYLGDSILTCFAEAKPRFGEQYILGKFSILRPLNILDLTIIPKIIAPSIFSEDYEPDIVWATDFFRRFVEEISTPIREEDAKIDYLPTQVFCEYVRSLGYDGIKFRSSQNSEGVNLTLFCGPELYQYPEHDYIGTSFNGEDYQVETLPVYSDFVNLEEISVGKFFMEISLKGDIVYQSTQKECT